LITLSDFSNSIPFLILALLALITMLLETIFPKDKKHFSETTIFYFSILAVSAAVIFSFADLTKNLFIYNQFIRVNTFTAIMNILILGGTLITILSSKNYLEKENINYGEYYSLLFFSVLGMMLMIQANDLIILFIGLELMSISFYVLSGFMRKKIESNESALKYFLLGAFITGFFLLGIAMIYGYNGSTNYTNIRFTGNIDLFYRIGLILVFTAFIFKIGSFPLQMWIPDVYQGAPTIVTGMMSSIGKTAAFGAMIVFFNSYNFKDISTLIAIISILTMLYGNIVALSQTNIKRLLAYSSIAHAGYLLIGFIVLTNTAVYAILFYLIAYILMQLGAFIIAAMIEENIPEHSMRNSLESYKGIGKSNPGLSVMLTIFLLSLAGIPPLAGFWGKYYIFLTAIQNNYLWVAITGIILSLIGVYYYIKIILYMWFYNPVTGSIKLRQEYSFAAALLSVAGISIFGIWPELIIKYIRTVII
jgi:NADH-quinone oxidoreductase subunit N